VRRGLRGVARAALAGGLGVAAAALVSCGSSSTKGLIPVANSEPLQSDFEEVSRSAAAGNGSCTATEAALAKTEADFRALPGSVDNGLRTRLREGIEALHGRALSQCAQPAATSTATTSKTTTTETAPATTATTTTPTTTATTPTTSETTPTTSTAGPGGGTSPGSEASGKEQGGGEEAGGERSGGVGPPGLEK
jgi:hypothetical protein